MRFGISFATSLLLVAMAAPPATAAARRLPALAADPAKVSISGLSSGAFMAVQYSVAFSAGVTGVGVVAGGPYNCAFVNLGGILTCMSGAPIGQASWDAALGFAALGQIDAASHIAGQRVYLFTGSKDAVVNPAVVAAVRDFYRAAHVPASNIEYVDRFAAGHAFVSDDLGGACSANAAPFINECPDGGTALYDQPAAILAHILGPLQPKATAPSAKPVAFDQRRFGRPASGLAPTGFVYVPADCRRTAGCAVHVVFHGCAQGTADVGDDVYARLGFNEWADTNRIIVLYPQVERSNLPLNPQGCWDWWGYSGLDFQTRSGAQLAAVHAIVARLTAH